MERQVFISHATDDPDWAPEAIEALAATIRDAGIAVRLDLWHQQAMDRHLSLGEWRGWMDAAVRSSTYVLCLVSPHYLRLWERRPDDPGGFGVAFESVHLIHGLYLLKQRSYGRILTLRPEGCGYDNIPPDLAVDCPAYRWAADRTMLLSHLGKAALPERTPMSDAPASRTPASSSPVSRSPTALPLASPSTQAPSTPALSTPSPSSPAAAPAPQPRPTWASASGKDDYGHWADFTVSSVTQRLRWIPPTGPNGFEMGDEEEGSSREVLEVGFWLADTLCTEVLWEVVNGGLITQLKRWALHEDSWLNDELQQHPVRNVSWDHVMGFIGRLAGRARFGLGETICLPTEVEWEYAARAGTRTAYWWGDKWGGRDRGNVLNLMGGTTRVDQYPPNPWGLHDIHGNLYEWTDSIWQSRVDSGYDRQNKLFRVVRGGCWSGDVKHARASARRKMHHATELDCLGFRFAIRSNVGPDGR